VLGLHVKAFLLQLASIELRLRQSVRELILQGKNMLLVLIQLILLDPICLVHLGCNISLLCEYLFHFFTVLLKHLLLLTCLDFEILKILISCLNLIYQFLYSLFKLVGLNVVLHLDCIYFLL
jgi:hypothetical protein